MPIVALGLLLFMPYHWYCKWVAKRNPEKGYILGYKLVRFFFGTCKWMSGCKCTVIGKENIPDEPVMFVGNHRSYFDIICTHNAVKQPMGFMSKDGIKKIPIMHYYMDDIGCTYLDRHDIKSGLETINKTAEIIKSGHHMMIFPEGKRNKGEELLPFKDGAFQIARKVGCLIVPVAIAGTDGCMEGNKHGLIWAQKTVVEFLPPVDIRGLTPKERKEVIATIPDMIQEARLKNLPMTVRKHNH